MVWDTILSSVMEGKVEEAGRLFEESALSFLDPTLSSNPNTTTTSNDKRACTVSSTASISDDTVPVANTRSAAAIAVQPKFLEAAKKGTINEVKRCVEQSGAHLDARDGNGMCALHLAAWNGHTEMVRYLLSKGASPMARSKQGSTPVHAAAEKGYTEIVRMLLDHEEPHHHQQTSISIAGSMISNEERQPTISEDEHPKEAA